MLTCTEYCMSSIVPIQKYMLGTYKRPIVIITCSVLPDKIFLVNKIIDVPILYENSELIYYTTTLEELKEKIECSEKVSLQIMLDYLVEKGVLEKEEQGNTNIYIDENNKKIYTM